MYALQIRLDRACRWGSCRMVETRILMRVCSMADRPTYQVFVVFLSIGIWCLTFKLFSAIGNHNLLQARASAGRVPEVNVPAACRPSTSSFTPPRDFLFSLRSQGAQFDWHKIYNEGKMEKRKIPARKDNRVIVHFVRTRNSLHGRTSH
jgi:hypothetical protein